MGKSDMGDDHRAVVEAWVELDEHERIARVLVIGADQQEAEQKIAGTRSRLP